MSHMDGSNGVDNETIEVMHALVRLLPGRVLFWNRTVEQVQPFVNHRQVRRLKCRWPRRQWGGNKRSSGDVCVRARQVAIHHRCFRCCLPLPLRM